MKYAKDLPTQCSCCNAPTISPPHDEDPSMLRNRLQYRQAKPLHVIAGSPEEKADALSRIATKYGNAITALQGLTSRNREAHEAERSLQEYYCIGCDVPGGALRAQVFGLAAYPLLQMAMNEITGRQLTLQCYFPQTYEDKAGIGPGGIIGTQPATAWEAPDTTASRSLKYWNWVDSENILPYLPEDEAEIALWKLSYIAFPRGKYWLASLPEDIPSTGLEFPPDLTHDLHALLGVPAMQRLVTRHLGRNLLMLDATRIIRYEDLHWSRA